MNKRLLQLQALLLAGLMATTPMSFAGTKTETIKAMPVTQAVKTDMNFSVSGTITSIDENAITLESTDKIHYSLKLSQFKNLSDFQALKVKIGSNIKVNCKLESANSVKVSEYSVSSQAVKGKVAIGAAVTKTVPAVKLQETAKLDVAKAIPVTSVVVDANQPFELPFAISVEIGGKVFSLK